MHHFLRRMPQIGQGIFIFIFRAIKCIFLCIRLRILEAHNINHKSTLTWYCPVGIEVNCWLRTLSLVRCVVRLRNQIISADYKFKMVSRMIVVGSVHLRYVTMLDGYTLICFRLSRYQLLLCVWLLSSKLVSCIAIKYVLDIN